MRILLSLIFCITLANGAVAQEETDIETLQDYIEETFFVLGYQYLPVNGTDNKKLVKGQYFAEILFDCKESENICDIKENLGGSVALYALAGYAAHLSNKRFRILGICASACAVFADLARDKVCMMPRTVFLFHKWRWSTGEFAETRHSPDVHAMVLAYGGFPEEGVTKVYARNAKHIWHACKLRSTIAAAR
ncbi:hypothetical protein KW798_01525 [Candidatus Parcubacteria bacterium]|nr:hypothetical protein [Candidatus Parcubacteria bacterium]